MVFVENNPMLDEAIERAQALGIIIPMRSESMESGGTMVAQHMADTMVAGIDMTSYDVIVGVREWIGVKKDVKTFSSSYIFEFSNGMTLMLADGAVSKAPDPQRLADIVLQTVATHRQVIQTEPRVAMLSFSSFGSGGKDPSIDKMLETMEIVRKADPSLKIDGEMQLDAALIESVGKKKGPTSTVAGYANIMIVPDLNAGNILAKAIEFFGRANAYGPLLQGFNAPVSDLSRGSTVDDIYGTIIVSALRAVAAEVAAPPPPAPVSKVDPNNPFLNTGGPAAPSYGPEPIITG